MEKVFTDYRPVAELVFVKERNKTRKDNIEIDLESFIAVKGISALGNQLTKDKILEINALESFPYEDEANPESENEVSKDESSKKIAEIEVHEEHVEKSAVDDTSNDENQSSADDAQGQTTLF